MAQYNYGGDGGDWGRGGPLVPAGWGGPPRGDWGPPQHMWGGGWGVGGGRGGGGRGGGFGQPPPQPPQAALAWWMGGYQGGYGGGYGPPGPNRASDQQKPSDQGIEVGGGSATPGINDHRVHENALKSGQLDQVKGRLKIGVGCYAGQKNIAHIGEFRVDGEEPRQQPQGPPRDEQPRQQPQGPPPGYGFGVGVNFRGY